MLKNSFRCPFSVLLSLFLLWSTLGVAGSLPLPPDSLKAALSSAKGEKARALVLFRVAEALVSSLDTAAYLYADEAERIAIKIKDRHLQGRILDLKGTYYLESLRPALAVPVLKKAEELLVDAPPIYRAANIHNLGGLYNSLNRPEKVPALYHQAYRIYTSAKHKKGQGEISNALGFFFVDQAQFDSAAFYLFRAVKEFRESPRPEMAAIALGNIAVMYFRQERFKEALPYAIQSLELRRSEGDTVSIGIAFTNIASINFALGNEQKAFEYYRKAIQLYQNPNHEAYLLTTYNGLARAYQKAHQTDSAAYFLKRAIAISEKKGPTWGGALVMGNLADLYFSVGRIEEAEEWATKALSRSKPGNDVTQLKVALMTLEKIALQKWEYRKAYEFLKRTEQLNKKQFNIEQSQLTEELRIGYEAAQAEKQIQLLRQNQELVELKQQQQIASISSLAILILALACFLVWRYRAKQKLRDTELRTRIAADLHDDVGSLLTQISLQGSLLEEGLYSEEEQKKQLSQIGQASRQAVQQMSDVVWAVDARNEGAQQLLDRMRDYAYELLSTAGIEVNFEAMPDLTLPPENLELRQNVYYIYKEALHNTVKHAQATQVNITLAAIQNQLVLEVKDNGIGKGVNGRLSGHGLRNMEMRAEAIGGKISFSNDAGFAVKLQVPLTRMFMR